MVRGNIYFLDPLNQGSVCLILFCVLKESGLLYSNQLKKIVWYLLFHTTDAHQITAQMNFFGMYIEFLNLKEFNKES